MFLLGISCGEDREHDVTVPPPESEEAPALPVLPRWETVQFHNDSPTARDAKVLVQGELNRAANDVILINDEVMAGFRSARWGPLRSDCRSYVNQPFGTCTFSFGLCRSDTGFVWTVIVDGPCGGGLGGVPIEFDNWLKASGTTDASAGTGRFIFYDIGTTSVRSAWEWSLSPDHGSASWSFYRHGIDQGDLEGTLARTRNPDGSTDDVWTPRTGLAWEAHIPPGAASGQMKFYTLVSDGQSRLSEEVIWETGHGSWTSYGEDGEETATRTW